MSFKIYCINRYNSQIEKRVKNFSGYEQLIKYCPLFFEVRGNKYLSKIVTKVFISKKPKNYLTKTVGEEILACTKAIFTGYPIFYLYADKDAFIGPLIKRTFNIKRLKLFGTLHWPKEISLEYAFYKYNLHTEFDGIITLSSSLNNVKYNKSCVIQHGINRDFWHNDNPQYFENNYLILGISNRDHLKQIVYIKKIQEIDPAAQFTVLLTQPEYVSKYAHLTNVTVIQEKISDNDLKNLYKRSKAVILFQYHCLASNVVMESISMCVPLLTNRIGDVAEYLGKDYPLFLDKNSDEVLRHFCFSADFRNEIVDYLSELGERFDWDVIAEKTVDFIYCEY